MQTARLGIGQYEALACTRDADVGQPPLLGETAGFLDRLLAREQAVFEADQEDQRKLQPLGRVQRHQLHAGLPGLALALAGLERSVRQERAETRQARFEVLRRRFEAVGHVDQFVEVLDARFGAAARVGLVERTQPAPGEHVLDLLVQRQGFAVGSSIGGGAVVGEAGRLLRARRQTLPRQHLDQVEERAQRIARASGQLAAGQLVQRGLPQRGVVVTCAAAQHLERAIADAARRRVDDALERGIVVAIGDQAQIRQRIADLGALEVAQSAVDAIRDRMLDQLFLEVARLRIGAVQHCDVRCRTAAVQMFADAIDDVARLVLLVVRGVDLDRRAGRPGGPQLLAEPVVVVGDHRVGGAENRRGGTVVLFEPDRRGIGEVAQEVLHVLDARAAPAVDRLIVVADDEHLGTGAGQHADPGVLQRIGVLELVDQQMAPALAVVREQGLVVEPQLVRAQQQLGEVDQAAAPARVLVGAVDRNQGLCERIAVGLDRVGAAALVLGAVDEPGRLPRREARLVQSEALDRALDQALLIVAVEDLERLGQAGLAPVPAQQAMRDAVERADRQAARAGADQRFGARTHLAGGLVRERHRQDRPRRYALDLEQPADPMGQYARLARTGAGQDQTVARRRADGFALRRIQRVEQVRNVHPSGLAGRRDAGSCPRRDRGAQAGLRGFSGHPSRIAPVGCRSTRGEDDTAGRTARGMRGGMPGEGFEPPTFGLQNRCTTAVLTRRKGSIVPRKLTGR